jgi:hypothetical protein
VRLARIARIVEIVETVRIARIVWTVQISIIKLISKRINELSVAYSEKKKGRLQ